MSIRERIIRAGENNDPYNHSHNDAMLAAAREMALIIKERIDWAVRITGAPPMEYTYEGLKCAAEEIDKVLAELSDGQTARET